MVERVVRPPGFSWDDYKDERNLKAHKIGFEVAARVFDDKNVLEKFDPRHRAEDRYYAIGMVDGMLLYVAFAVWDEPSDGPDNEGISLIRLISARRTDDTSDEDRMYYENKAANLHR
jgi:uncharacterized DUF497 family protein